MLLLDDTSGCGFLPREMSSDVFSVYSYKQVGCFWTRRPRGRTLLGRLSCIISFFVRVNDFRLNVELLTHINSLYENITVRILTPVVVYYPTVFERLVLPTNRFSPVAAKTRIDHQVSSEPTQAGNALQTGRLCGRRHGKESPKGY